MYIYFIFLSNFYQGILLIIKSRQGSYYEMDLAAGEFMTRGINLLPACNQLWHLLGEERTLFIYLDFIQIMEQCKQRPPIFCNTEGLFVLVFIAATHLN